MSYFLPSEEVLTWSQEITPGLAWLGHRWMSENLSLLSGKIMQRERSKSNSVTVTVTVSCHGHKAMMPFCPSYVIHTRKPLRGTKISPPPTPPPPPAVLHAASPLLCLVGRLVTTDTDIRYHETIILPNFNYSNSNDFMRLQCT